MSRRRAATIFYLERFGFRSPLQVQRMGSTPVDVTLDLGPFPSVRSLAPHSRSERHARIQRHYRRLFDRLRVLLPPRTEPEDPECRRCRCTIPAASLGKLRRHPSVQTIWLDRVRGRRERRDRKSVRWYAVQARFAVQVEGRTRGMQTYEDRIVITRATNPADASRRAQKEFQQYAQTYVGGENDLVRWHFEKVLDVYAMAPFDFRDPVIEVFSVLKGRRLRPEAAWNPPRR